jgi:hypothetical protein
MSGFITPERLAKIALKLVDKKAQLALMVNKDFSDSNHGGWEPGAGATLRVPIPSAAIARNRNPDADSKDVKFDHLDEESMTVELKNNCYSGVILSEQALSLDLSDFSRQVLRPMSAAITDQIEGAVADALTDQDPEDGVSVDLDNPLETMTRVRRVLRQRGVRQDTDERSLH